jgi:mono/diheme cytochrome c family protein
MTRREIQQAAAAGVLALGVTFLVAGGSIACTSAASKPSGEPAAGTGASPTAAGAAAGAAKALVEKKCSTCHGLDRFEGKKADAKGWTEIVDNMVKRGMSATEAERKEIVDYLASR